MNPVPDTLLLNGRILTVDDRSSVAEALWISGGRIVAVGDEKDIRALATPGAEIIDLAGAPRYPA